MLMIIFSHFAYHGGFEDPTCETISIPNVWYMFLRNGGKLGVNIFILISGYFLIKSPGPDIKHMAKIWTGVAFYSVGIYVLHCISGGGGDFSIRHFAKQCFPVTYGLWWFATDYFLLYVFHGLLNKVLNSFTQSQWFKWNIFLIIIWSIIPTVTFGLRFDLNSLLWFFTLYSIAGYIRVYGTKVKCNHTYLIFAIVTILISNTLTVLITYLSAYIPSLTYYQYYFYKQYSIPTFLSAYFLLKYFLGLKMRPSMFINSVASTCFGIYLIHDNGYVRHWLWHSVFNNAQYANELILIPYSIMTVFIVFIGCGVIEYLRLNTLDKWVMPILCRMGLFLKKIFDKNIDAIIVK